MNDWQNESDSDDDSECEGSEIVAQSNITCPACSIPEEPSDEQDGIPWYGSDIGANWWHRHCLPLKHQASIIFSTRFND